MTRTFPRSATREEWLLRACLALRALFIRHDLPLPTPGLHCRVSCSWPGGGSPRKRIGEAWSSRSSRDKAAEIFISPVLSQPLDVLHVLVHELLHHSVGCDVGHKGPFRRGAKALGLEGKMTATVPGPALRDHLTSIAQRLGSYPHGGLSLASRRKQPTRLLKLSCTCGLCIRITQKWIDRMDADGVFFMCPICNEMMEER